MLALAGSMTARGGGLRRRATAPSAGGRRPLPQGSEPVTLDPADVHHRHRPSLLADATRDTAGCPARRRRTEIAPAVTVVRVTGTGPSGGSRTGSTARVVRDHSAGARRARRGHVRLVRAGRRRQRLVPRRAPRGPTSTARFRDAEGSFEAGVDGAQAGIAMPARPRAGLPLPPGVLRGPRRGPGARSSACDEQVAGAVRPLRRDVLMTTRREPAGAPGARVQVLRPRRRAGTGRRGLGRSGPRRTGAVQLRR